MGLSLQENNLYKTDFSEIACDAFYTEVTWPQLQSKKEMSKWQRGMGSDRRKVALNPGTGSAKLSVNNIKPEDMSFQDLEKGGLAALMAWESYFTSHL